MNGYEAFRNWLPEPLLRMIAGNTENLDLFGQTLTVALVVLLVALVLRLLLKVLSGFLHLATGQSLAQSTSRPRLFWRNISGLLAVGLPWVALWLLYEDGTFDDALYVWAGIAATVWVVLRAADHHKAWLDTRKATVVLRKGFGISRIHDLMLPVAELFADTAGQPLTFPNAALQRAEVVPRRAGWLALVAHLGSEQEAEAFARRVAVRMKLRPRPRWKVIDT
jgi:hypothetical protein